MAATTKAFKVGIIIGSQRVVRIGPQVANFVHDAITASDTTLRNKGVSFDLIDIAEHNLPIFNEPGIPQQINSVDGYEHETTRVWSRRIAACHAFVFVSAQRNWGIPSELKNAIDYLYHEWKGKPAMIVTYGGHGGEQCATHLNMVLGSMGVRVVKKMVHMSFPGAEFRVKAFKGEQLDLDANYDGTPWADHRAEIVSVWDEMMKKMLESGQM